MLTAVGKQLGYTGVKLRERLEAARNMAREEGIKEQNTARVNRVEFG